MISLIVAHDRNGVIGNGPDIPWHLPADFKRFKEITMGHPVIMGRTTFESIGKPLPGRLNIIVTRDESYEGPEGTLSVTSVEAGIAAGEQENSGEVFVLGGSQIYQYALEHNLIERAYITEVQTEVQGDIFFPMYHINNLNLQSYEYREADEKNLYDMSFAVYDKTPVISGKALACKQEQVLYAQVQELGTKPKLAIYVIGEHPATMMYVQKKRELAERIGVEFIEHNFDIDVSEQELEQHILKHQKDMDGVVIQLPLLAHIDTQKLCGLVDSTKDPDLLNSSTEHQEVYPPVVAAIDYILSEKQISPRDKQVVVVGKGKLVGAPAIDYFTKQGAQVVALDKEDGDISSHTQQADIIVTGAGVSDLITPQMVKEGVVLLDAGTSGSSGSLRGDIDWECEQKASLFARSPGGIGPLTVVSLFQNLITLIEKK